MWMLIAIAGPDKGQAHPLDPAATRDRPMVLGREGNPFRLSDKRASRRHAGLFRENGKWVVDDLGSTTGTLRNHKPVEGTQTLKEGDFLQVGRTVLTLSRMDAAAASATGSGAGGATPLRATRPEKLSARSGPHGLAGWVLGAGSAAAVIVIGLGVFNQQQAAQLAEEQRAAAARAAERVSALEARVLAKLEEEAGRSVGIAGSIEALRPAQAETAEALAEVRLAVDKGGERLGADLAGLRRTTEAQAAAGERLAAGLENRDAALVDALAAATADRLRPDLSPLPGDLVGRLNDVSEQLATLPERLEPQITGVVEAVASSQQASRDEVLAAVGDAARGLEERLPGRTEFNERMARVEERLGRLPDAATLDARLASITEALRQRPSDPADEQRHEAIRAALASIAADLKDRPDAAALREQLEAVAAKRPVEPDPILAQVLAGLAAQRAATERVEAGLSSLAAAREPDAFDAEAVAAGIVAALPEAAKASAVTGDPATATPLDPAALAAAVEAALLKTPLADAGGLREMVRAEVSLAMESAASDDAESTAEGQIDRRSLERAYRRAFESNRKQVLPGGRVLDPAAARAAGVSTWRDWYLIDEFAERMRLAREASRIRGTLEDPTVVSLPSR